MLEQDRAIAAFQRFAELGRIADYKERTRQKVEPFDYSKCPDPDAGTPRESVTLCGVVLQSNQLGNIIFGIVAVRADMVSVARDFGQGRLKIAGFGPGPDPSWRAEGEGYRQSAFELGVDYEREVMAKRKCDFSEFVKIRASALTRGNGRMDKIPSTHETQKHSGPQTDLNRKPLVTFDANRPK